MWNWATRQSNVPGKARMAALCAFAALMLCALAPVRAGVNNWTSLGPEGGRIPRLAFGPAGSARVLALAGSTLYRSNDNGQTWEELFSQTSLFDFAAHPANPNIVFGLGSGNFLYASTDGGVTFTQRPSSTPRFRRIEFSRDGSILYGAVDNAMYRSSDLGVSWQAGAAIPGTTLGLLSFYIDPTDATRLIGAYDVNMYMSADGGDNWTAFAPPPDRLTNLAFSIGSTRIWGATATGLYYTDNGGVTWVSASLPGLIWAVAVDPANPASVYATRDDRVYHSSNAGGQWSLGTGTVGLMQGLQFVFDAATQDRVLLASATGIWSSSDAGAQWVRSNRGLLATTTSRFTSSAGSRRTYFAVNGEIHYLEAGATAAASFDPAPLLLTLPAAQFQQVTALLAQPALVQGESDRLFASGLNGGLARSVDGGNSWTLVFNAAGGSFQGLASAPNDRNLLLAGSLDRIVRSMDGGNSWSDTSGIEPGTNVIAIAFASPTTVYATGQRRVYKSVDGGMSWLRADTGVPLAAVINSLAVQPGSDQVVYLGSDRTVYRTVDGALSWREMFPSTSGGYYAVTVDPFDPGSVYAADGYRFQRSTDGGETWRLLSSVAPPRPSLTAFKIDPQVRGRYLLGTFGNGVLSYTVASDLNVLVSGRPASPAGAGSRASFNVTVTNNGPHEVANVTLRVTTPQRNVQAAGTGAGLTCSQLGPSPVSFEMTCTTRSIPSQSSAVLPITVGFESDGPVNVSATVESAQSELTPADNSVSYSASYEPPVTPQPGSGGGGGGGGAISWWLVAALSVLFMMRRCFGRTSAHWPGKLISK